MHSYSAEKAMTGDRAAADCVDLAVCEALSVLTETKRYEPITNTLHRHLLRRGRQASMGVQRAMVCHDDLVIDLESHDSVDALISIG